MTTENLYQTPVRDVYVSNSGEIQLGRREDERVQPMNAMHEVPAGFELTVQRMSLNLLANNRPIGLGDAGEIADFKQMLEIGAGVFGAISGGIGAGIAVVEALQLLGILDKEDPFNELYNRMEARLKVILQVGIAASALSTMQNIRAILGHSETAGQIIAEHIDRNFPASPHAAAQLAQADYWSRYAVTTLGGSEYWMRPFVEEITDGDGEWKFGIRERPAIANGMVRDYRLALPAYLKAVSVRLAVLRGMDPHAERVAEYRREILQYAESLRGIEASIKGGLVKTAEDPSRASWWKSRGWWNGAADIHTGYARMKTGWSAFVIFDEIDLMVLQQRGRHPLTWEEYLAHYNQAASMRWWALYHALGLFEFWKIIPDVEAMTRVPSLFDGPDFTAPIAIKPRLPKASTLAQVYTEAAPLLVRQRRERLRQAEQSVTEESFNTAD